MVVTIIGALIGAFFAIAFIIFLFTLLIELVVGLLQEKLFWVCVALITISYLFGG